MLSDSANTITPNNNDSTHLIDVIKCIQIIPHIIIITYSKCTPHMFISLHYLKI